MEVEIVSYYLTNLASPVTYPSTEVEIVSYYLTYSPLVPM